MPEHREVRPGDSAAGGGLPASAVGPDQKPAASTKGDDHSSPPPENPASPEASKPAAPDVSSGEPPEAARQDDSFIAVGESPDPCRTPPGDVAIPYHITAPLGEALSVSPNVTYQGAPVILADESNLAQVTGDEAGTGGGVKSGTHAGDVRFIEGAPSVMVNGCRIVREKDLVSMNNGNTTGRIHSLGGAAPPGGTTAEGKPEKPANPPVPGPRKAKPQAEPASRPPPSRKPDAPPQAPIPSKRSWRDALLARLFAALQNSPGSARQKPTTCQLRRREPLMVD